MKDKNERILLVESSPETSEVIYHQILKPLGYQVLASQTVSDALTDIYQFSPDIIITNLRLADLSGKDLLVALSAQGIEIPVIAIAEKGMEADLIAALRLGATDYCVMPIREVEIASAVDRVTKQIRSRKEKENLFFKLEQENRALQKRVDDLTKIITIGKAITSIKKQKELQEKLVEAAIYISSADKGWLLLRQGNSHSYNLAAQKNLPHNYAFNINQIWNDGISCLVAKSGKSFTLHGEPLKKYWIHRLGQSALFVPLKHKTEVKGLLVAMRSQPKPFTQNNQNLVEFVADYASITMKNIEIFENLENHTNPTN